MINSLKLLSVFFLVNMIFISAANATCSNHDNKKDGMYYMGLDYVYSNLDMASQAGGFDYDYDSASINVGAIHNNTGVEVFYQDSLSETRHSATVKTKGELRVYGIDAAYYHSMNDKTDFITTAGLANYEFKAKTLTMQSDTDDEIGYRLGAGFLYKLDDNWDARAIARYALVDNKYFDDMMEVSLGVRYNF